MGRKQKHFVNAQRRHTRRGRREGGVSKSRRSGGSQHEAGGEKCGVNGKRDLVIVVAKASPSCPDDGHNRLLVHHFCVGLQILCSSGIDLKSDEPKQKRKRPSDRASSRGSVKGMVDTNDFGSKKSFSCY